MSLRTSHRTSASLNRKTRPHSIADEGRRLCRFDQAPASRRCCARWEGIMDHDTALSKARNIADRVLAPAARQNDKEGRFSTVAVEALGQAGLLGLMLPTELGGAGL